MRVLLNILVLADWNMFTKKWDMTSEIGTSSYRETRQSSTKWGEAEPFLEGQGLDG
jgi:hypothetical protein